MIEIPFRIQQIQYNFQLFMDFFFFIKKIQIISK